MLKLDDIQQLIRDVPDFPKPGILFKDITPVLGHGEAFHALTHYLSELVPREASKIVAVESRGFILGAAVSQLRGLGLVLVRKAGKLPHKILSHSYQLEYGQDTLQIHEDAFAKGDSVVIIDDVLATGGTAAATEHLCDRAGAKVLNHVFMMELGFLNGRKKLKAPARSLIQI